MDLRGFSFFATDTTLGSPYRLRLRQELDELDTQFANFLHEKDYLDAARETRAYELSVCRRIRVLRDKLETLLDGTGITWEAYEMAKKNLH